jgi:CubicO group peptidase (beta-lactamase class C family)
MLLAEDGKIGLDDTITKYLSGLPQACSEVTVRQLLTHTSGIPSFVQDQGSGAAIIAFAEKTDSSEQIIRWAATRPLKFAPGEGRKYTSTGYHLLGMIIENVTGKPTFTPAIMESAAGGLVSTVEDLARWEIALESGAILKPATLAQMAVPIKLENDSIVQARLGRDTG